MQAILELLRELGLTRTEAKCYLTLLELGPSRSGEIIKKSGLHNSVTFTCLKRLSEIGLVKFIKKSKRKEYSAVAPETLLEILEDKKSKLRSLLPEIKRAQNRERQDAEVFYGINGVKAAHLEQIKEGKPKEVYMFFSLENEYYNEEIKRFFTHFNTLRKSKGIKVMSLIQTDKKYEKIFDIEFKRSGIQFKKINQDVPIGTAIFKDSVLQIVWDPEEPIAFLLKSKKLAEQYKNHFNGLWKKVK